MSSRETMIVLAVIVGIVLLVPVLSMSIMGFGIMGPGMMARGMMGGSGPVIAFLLLAGFVLLVVVLTRRSDAQPIELLKERLARGDLTREQYEELKQALQS